MILFVAVIYGGARGMLLSSSAERVASVSDQIAREIGALNAGPFGPVSARTSLADQTFLDGFAGTGLFIEAYNQYGRPIGKSTNLGTSDLPRSGLVPWKPRGPLAAETWGFATTPTGRLLVNAEPLHNGKSLEATVYVAESLRSMDEILKNFGNFLFLGLGIALMFLLLSSFSLARAALGPINEITNAAREISSEDLATRLNWKGRADELGALAKTFDEMLSRLEAAFARERRFIADASHELKTPLTVINANAQMLERWGARDQNIMRESLSTIETESAAMARVINAMLTLAKTDNAQALSMESVDLGDVVAEVGTSLRPKAQEKHLTLCVDAKSDAWIRGEPGLIRQLVTNLTENAIKFTEKGEVTLDLRRLDGHVLLAVGDTGPGIPADALPHIFDRFFRADPSHSRSVEGTGLGLAVVNNIVRVHGGQISVASVVGKGTTITVELPLEQRESPAETAG